MAVASNRLSDFRYTTCIAADVITKLCDPPR